ncbi:MAG: ABC transporter permease [Alphaproteobacteria bacterium]
MAETSLPPPARTRKRSTARITGHVLMALWCTAGIGLVWFMIDAYNPRFYDRYTFKFLRGLMVTLQIVGVSLVIGAVISIPIALGRLSRNRLVSSVAFGYSYLLRGTPLLVQTYLIYYGLGVFHVQLEAAGLWWFFRDAVNCIIFVFSLNTSAYQAEILAGAIRNVPKEQVEAGRAVGLNNFTIYYKIIIPQALITALRPYGNEIILMIKGSAVASLVTVFDLMGETRRAYSRSFDFQTYIWAAIFYLIMVEALRNVWAKFEKRLTRHLVRESG